MDRPASSPLIGRLLARSVCDWGAAHTALALYGLHITIMSGYQYFTEDFGQCLLKKHRIQKVFHLKKGLFKKISRTAGLSYILQMLETFVRSIFLILESIGFLVMFIFNYSRNPFCVNETSEVFKTP